MKSMIAFLSLFGFLSHAEKKPPDFRECHAGISAEKEEVFLAKSPHHVFRITDTLHLPLANKREATFRNNPEDGKQFRNHRFCGFIGKLSSYLVRNSYFASWGFSLVSRRAGSRLRIVGVPAVSPTASYFAASNLDLGPALTPNIIQIGTRDGNRNRIVLEYAVPVKSSKTMWGPELVEWIDEFSIRIPRVALVDGVKKSLRPWIFRNQKGKWKAFEELRVDDKVTLVPISVGFQNY